VAEFPASPIPASEFMQGWLPKAFAESEAPEDVKQVDVRLGVRLDGDGGGEWVIHLDRGQMRVLAESRADTPFTLVQSVEDWRGSLWEGKGGAFGQQAAALFRPGAQPAGGAGRPGASGGMSPAAIEAMRALNGVIRMRVVGGAGGDWAVDFKLGPGEIPAQPTTTVTITAPDAEAMATGQLDPMQAFMSGKIQVAGDMGLMMQMQMIQMQAAAAATRKA
jgi:putative sterol carrier protein